jgi:uncharacterized protein (UPF0303 family)
MTVEQDIACINAQEKILIFSHFDNACAWDLGSRIKAECDERKVFAAIEVRLARETVFFFAMHNTAPTNADWVRRKRNTVELLQASSYAIGLALEQESSSLEKKMGLPLRDYAHHGGSFPIRTVGSGCLGCVTISGLPQREDHNLIVKVLAEMLNIEQITHLI